MPELIDRQRAITEIESCFCSECDCGKDKSMCGNCEYLYCMDILEQQPTIEAEPVRHGRWISCLKRLPEPLQNVIVCTDINTVTVAWLNGDHWTFVDTGNGHTEDWSFDAVKFWMPLPEPPEKE